MNSALVSVFVFVLACVPVRGDTVFMKDGTKRQGMILNETEEEVLLSVAAGEMSVEVSIPTLAIKSIVKAETANERLLNDYRKRLTSMNDKSTQDWYQLGLWCERQPYLKHQAARAFQTALELDPNHKSVRLKLGYFQYKGAWMTEEEVIRAKLFERQKEIEALPTEKKIDLIGQAFQQSNQSLRERTIRSEAQFEAERKLRKAAEKRIENLEDRIKRLEKLIPSKNTSSTPVFKERRSFIIIRGNSCCAHHPHTGFDCNGRRLPKTQTTTTTRPRSRMIPSVSSGN